MHLPLQIMLFLFVILLLGLTIASFLGSYKEGFESDSIKTNSGVSGTSGSSQNNNVKKSENATTKLNEKTNYDNYNHYHGTSYPSMFYAQNGGTAKIINQSGSYSILTTDSNGKTTTYTTNKPNSKITNATYYSSNGAKAASPNSQLHKERLQVVSYESKHTVCQ
jgi:hypothetical protein